MGGTEKPNGHRKSLYLSYAYVVRQCSRLYRRCPSREPRRPGRPRHRVIPCPWHLFGPGWTTLCTCLGRARRTLHLRWHLRWEAEVFCRQPRRLLRRTRCAGGHPLYAARCPDAQSADRPLWAMGETLPGFMWPTGGAAPWLTPVRITALTSLPARRSPPMWPWAVAHTMI